MAGLSYLADVNVLVAHFDYRHQHHAVARRALNELFERGDQLVLTSVTMSGAVRVLSSTVYRDALGRIGDLTRNLTELADAEATRVVEPGPGHWPIFRHFIDTGQFGYKSTTDAWFAALAIEQGATLVSFDGGFARFDGLAWRHLTV